MNTHWSNEARIIKEATQRAYDMDTPEDVRLFGQTMVIVADILEKKYIEKRVDND